MQFVKKYILKNKGTYLFAILFMFCSIALDMLNPMITRGIIDDVVKGGRRELLTALLAGLLVVTFGRALFGYFREYLFDLASVRVASDIRKDIFTHLSKLSISFYDNENTGELMARIKEDVDHIWEATGFACMKLIESVIYVILPATMLFILSWKLALIYMILLPLILYTAYQMERKLDQVFDKISDQAAVLNTTAQENIAGIRLVRSFARERYEEKKFAKENEKNYKLNYEHTHVWSSFYPKIEFISNVMTVIVITLGGILVIGDDITIGTLVAVNSYGIMLSWPMKELGWLMNVMAQAGASVKKVKRLFNEAPELVYPEKPQHPKNPRGHVKFDKVSFKRGEYQILENISFEVPAGGTIGIMGATGAGKTSVVNLLTRFYDTTEGTIEIDGVDVKNWDLTELRKTIAFVMQDVFLFSDSVKENICFGNDTDLLIEDQYPLEAMKKASAEAQAASFIQELPEGYDAVIGERGIGLSGGQKQRISIARAFLKNSRILVLDDATSALDMETEFEIQKAISEKTDITKFVIAHRISAIKDADEIIILDHGRIAERGTHKELLAQKGYYYDTFTKQYGDIETVMKGGEADAD